MFKTLFIAWMLVGISGCTASKPSDSTRCLDCVWFRALDTDLKPTGVLTRLDSAYCGDPISWEDVTVLEVPDLESLQETVDEELGTTAEYVDRWFAVELQLNYIRKVRETIARRGCNLLILGETRTHWFGGKGTNGVSGTMDFRMIRWGRY